MESILNNIFCGDCLEVMKYLPDKCIDLVVTSPPYDNLRQYKGYSFDFENTAKELFRVIKQGGVVVWVVGDATIKGSETGTSFRQALYFKEIGFNIHDTMIWEKDTQPCHDPRNKRYKQYFEYMFIFTKGSPKTYNEIQDQKTKNGGKVVGGSKRNPDGSMRPMGDNRRKVVVKEFMARKNIWLINTNKKSKHPAAFPEQLVIDHIISFSNENEIVLDPFIGSGTTAIACLRTGRNFIGIEQSQEYVNIANKRVEDEIKKILAEETI